MESNNFQACLCVIFQHTYHFFYLSDDGDDCFDEDFDKIQIGMTNFEIFLELYAIAS